MQSPMQGSISWPQGETKSRMLNQLGPNFELSDPVELGWGLSICIPLDFQEELASKTIAID